MKTLPPQPARLVDLRPDEHGPDVARMIRNAARAPTEPALLLKGRIRTTLRRKSASRRLHLRMALVSGSIFVAGGVVGGMVRPIFLSQPQKVESVENVYPSGPSRGPHHPRLSVPSAPNEPLPLPSESADSQPASTPAAATPAGASAPLGPLLTPAPTPSLPGAAAKTTTAPSQRLPPPTRPPERLPSLPKPWSAHSSAPARAVYSPTPAGLAGGMEAARPTYHRPPLVSMGESTARTEQPLWPPRPTFAAPLPEETTTSYAAAPAPTPRSRIEPRVPSTVASPPMGATYPTAPASVAPVSSEQLLLSRAVRSLRVEHRPEQSLLALNEYLARYPSGVMLPEANRLRAEALLALDEGPAALAHLNQGSAEAVPDGEEVRLVRGELRTSAGRWREALDDFDTVVSLLLVHPPASSKQRARLERALWGRASARSHLGDDAGARADLRECLRLFPQGRFAAQAASLLGPQR